MSRVQSVNEQLYPLLTDVCNYINHTDYNGLATGYIIIAALSDFSTEVGSKHRHKKYNRKLNPEAQDQLKFEEVKAIYHKLSEFLDMAKKQGGESAYLELASSVGNNLDSLLDDKFVNTKQSALLKSISESLRKEKNYIDVIRKRGIKLVDMVKDKGSYSRPYDYLTEDYKSIQMSFVPR